MIKINLLPKKEIKKAPRKLELSLPAESLKKIIIPLALTLILIIGIVVYFEITLADLQKEINQQRNTLAGLKQKIDEVKKFESINKEIENKTKLIEDFKRMQAIPLTILSTIVKKLPDGVWISKINYDDIVTIEGYAFSNLNVVSFVDNLKSTPQLNEVNLIETSQTEFEKQLIYKFVIKFKLKV